MANIENGSITYEVDEDGFLLDFDRWNENFAIVTARKCGMVSGLTELHWRIIHWVRQHVLEFGACPLADRTCRANNLRLEDLRELFPSGYLRGVCRIAGITYDQGVRGPSELPRWAQRQGPTVVLAASEGSDDVGMKTFTVDVRGFLVDPGEWDEEFVTCRAAEMKMPALTARHWEVIWYLRRRFDETGSVPTIYQTCEDLAMTASELAELFPHGYHGGAVRIAGLRATTGGALSPNQ